MRKIISKYDELTKLKSFDPFLMSEPFFTQECLNLGSVSLACLIKYELKLLFHLANQAIPAHLKGQYHAIFSNTLKIEKTLLG